MFMLKKASFVKKIFVKLFKSLHSTKNKEMAVRIKFFFLSIKIFGICEFRLMNNLLIKKIILISVLTFLNFLCLAQTFTTPEVFSFKKEVFTPISYYTGQANIAIPLIEIPAKEIKIPVVLTYVGGEGLRAVNPYSSVGMGWRVTAGGAITRTKNETCDEVISQSSGTPSGFFNLTPNSITNDYVRNNVSSYVKTASNGTQYFAPGTEYSPDVFSFSFLGYTGFFVMGYDGEFKIQSQDIVSVEKINNVSWPGNGNAVAFKLTANDGTKFTFGGSTGSMELSGGNQGHPYQCEAWYITRIELKNGEIVNFNYQSNSSTFVRFITSNNGSDNLAVCPVVLSEITFKGGKVLFTSSTVTQQISGQTSYPRMINKVELKDAASQLVTTADFSYSSESSQRYYLLDNVTVNGKKYAFEYYNRLALPATGVALGSDYWGFYNGGYEVTSVGTGNVSSTWDMYLNPALTHAARMPSFEHAKRGILTSITYPTGGVENYEYEPNTYSYKGIQTLGGKYYSFSEEPKIAGGLRIAKITQGDMVRKYKYVNSFDPNNPDYNPQTMSFIGFSSSGILYSLPGVPYFGRSVLNSLSIDGEPPIVYAKVIEFLADKSYTEYNMRSPLNKPDEDNNQSENQFSAWSSQPAIFNHYPKMAFVGSLGKSSSRSLERGQVSSIKVYDSSNTLKKSTDYSYATNPDRYNQYVSGVKITSTADQAMAQLGLELGLAYYSTGLYFSVIHSYKIYTFPVYLEKEVETNYDGVTPLQRTTEYQYNAQKLKSVVTTTKSNGDVIKTLTKYPADINSGIYGAMVQKKMLNYPVEQLQLINDKIVAGELTEYKANNITYLPNKKYFLKQLSPIAETAFNYFNGTSADSRYVTIPRIAYDNYDTFGNVTQVTAKLAKPTAYQWGYNDLYPVAMVTNAANNLTTSNIIVNKSGQLTLPGGSITFTKNVIGNVKLEIEASPGYTYGLQYHLSSITGNLCVSRTSQSCAFPSSVTISNLPAGTYNLSASLYSGNSPYQYINYTYQDSESVTTGAKEFFYEGFEDNVNAATAAPFAGSRYYTDNNGDYTVPFAIPNSRNYLVNYRYFENGVWQTVTKAFSSNMTLTEGIAIDEVRVYPDDAQITTYTYKPLVGVTSMTDAKGMTTFYEYDAFQRLKAVKDQSGNILKYTDYHYKN